MLRKFIDFVSSINSARVPDARSVESAQQAADRLIADGNQAEGLGQFGEACARYRAAVELAPKYALAHLNLGIGLEAAGDTDAAIRSYEVARELAPGNAYASYNLGRLRYIRGALTEAERLLLSALDSKPELPEASVTLAHVLSARGNLDAAAAVLKTVLEQRPDDVNALCTYATVLRNQGKPAEAESTLRRATAAGLDSANATNLLGNLLAEQGKWEEAASCYRKALVIHPDSRDAHLALANILCQQGHTDEAIACYERALALEPNSPEINSGLGNLLRDRGRLAEAAICYQRAIALRPESAEAHNGLGNALWDQGLVEESMACYRRAIELRPDFAEAHSGLGNALATDRSRLDEAIASYKKALELKPDFPEAHYNLGIALMYQNRHDEALECYRKVLALDSEHVQARWMLTIGQLPFVYGAGHDPGYCRAAFSRQLDELDRWFDASRAGKGFTAVGMHQPFCLAYQEENNRELLQRYGKLCARLMSAWMDREGVVLPQHRRDRDGVVRVGIVSQYFWNHSVWNAIVKGWFRELDRERFSLYAFYLGSRHDEEMQLAQSRATHFDQGGRGPRQWVDAILGQQLDVLVYPEVGMDPMTLKLASLRLAPVQVATWGHPETSGLPTIDYFISAEDMEPPGAQANYAERLVALPHLGCFYQARQVDHIQFDLSSWDIDADTPLLVSPGMPFKYMPQHDWIFAEIASRLGRCRIIFFMPRPRSMSEKLRQRLEKEFSRRGLDFDRFVTFIPWQPRPAFYGLLKRADVFLDTIGFSGFNTAMEAVECGLPIVTREGRFLRGRFASGILKRMGLHELVAGSEAGYVALSVKLCQDAGYREEVRQRIDAQCHVLFEDGAPIRAFETFLASVTARR